MKKTALFLLILFVFVSCKNDKTSEALAMLKQAADKLPDVSEVQYHYAASLLKSGKEKEARQILEKLLESGKSFDGREEARRLLE
mgnify:CR=1 FL=1